MKIRTEKNVAHLKTTLKKRVCVCSSYLEVNMIQASSRTAYRILFKQNKVFFLTFVHVKYNPFRDILPRTSGVETLKR